MAAGSAGLLHTELAGKNARLEGTGIRAACGVFCVWGGAQLGDYLNVTNLYPLLLRTTLHELYRERIYWGENGREKRWRLAGSSFL